MENGRVWKELKALAAGAQDLAQDDADETPAIEPEEHMEVKGSKLCDGDARLQRRHGDLLVLGSEVGTARANAAGRSLRSRTDQSQIKIVVPARAGAKMSDRHVRTQAAPAHATIWALWIVAAVGSG